MEKKILTNFDLLDTEKGVLKYPNTNKIQNLFKRD